MSISSPMTTGCGCRGGGSSLRDRLCITASLPFWCGMFVYRDDTSIDASMQVWGSSRVSIWFMKSIESWMKDGRL